LPYAATVLDALNSGVIAKRPEQWHRGVNTVKRMLFFVDGDSGHAFLSSILLGSIVAQIVPDKR
jgi:hypothetical protein